MIVAALLMLSCDIVWIGAFPSSSGSGSHGEWTPYPEASPIPFNGVTPAPHRIFLVEDHALMRMAVSTLLAAEADLDLYGTAGSAEEALNVGTWTACDLLLTDVSLPGMDGITLVGRVHAERPALPIVVVSASVEHAPVDRAKAAGASAYLSKNSLGDTLAPTLRRILGGAPLGEAGDGR